jgi:Fe-S-cluster-containing hydrogenase component 2
VVKVEDLGIDYPVICRQCVERYCLRCPESVFEVGPLGQIIASPTLCVACGTCETLCPIGAIELYDDIPYVCDLCGGDPRCVKECNVGAIEFVPDQKDSVSLERFKKQTKGWSPEEKRLHFALDQTMELRKQWKASAGV